MVKFNAPISVSTPTATADQASALKSHPTANLVPPTVTLTPPVQSARVGKLTTPHDEVVEARLKMPNERDESVTMTAAAPDPMIEQAAVDVARGLQDTSKGAELNQAYKKLK